jgi:hypothetical protein
MLQSHLFDYYHSRLRSAHPNTAAMLFGLRVTRSCQSGVVTCHSGGFIGNHVTLDFFSISLAYPALLPV